MRTFKVTNTLEGKKVEFKPAKPGKVLMYSCGPTVYGPLHIGNARALYTGDLFYRWLKHLGYDVNFVRNYTDVDDKIITRANQEGLSSEEVAQKYIDYAEYDMKLMGLGKPTRTVKVTESMEDIISTIQALIDRGHAYVVNGEVFFSIDSFPSYGKLSGKNVEELQAGARVDVDVKKRNPMDFSLWKPKKMGEPFWPSPWSEGRPGWHIECSAMVRRWLGDTIDLHHGGQDLIFPHHENEIAQSEGATGKTFCTHWVHNGFLTVSKEKMSKSLGNIMSIREFCEKFGGEVLRYFFAKHHYRSPFDFDDSALEDVLQELERVYLARKWAEDSLAEPVVPGASGAAWKEVSSAQECLKCMEDELSNDLNTPGAVAALFIYIRSVNAAEGKAAGQAGRKAASTPERQSVARELLKLINEGIGPILNVFQEDTARMLAQIENIRRQMRADRGNGDTLSDEQVQALLDERKAARAAKNFARADEIRKELDAKGIVILDSPTGTTWKFK